MLKIKVFKLAALAAFIFVLGISVFAQQGEQKQAGRPLQVTYNPRAEYTPQARINGLSGWIQLRVTFLDTGQIGDIYYVTESDAGKNLSKAGLLKNAYEAAKQIKFLPAIKDSAPITVTRILVYSFAIGDRPVFNVRRN
jgi:hypothetical protein